MIKLMVVASFLRLLEVLYTLYTLFVFRIALPLASLDNFLEQTRVIIMKLPLQDSLFVPKYRKIIELLMLVKE